MSSGFLCLKVTSVSWGLAEVCRECVHACRRTFEECMLSQSTSLRRTRCLCCNCDGGENECLGERSRDSTHVQVSLKGVCDEEYVRDIFKDLEAIIRNGEEGIWCYGEQSFIDVSVFPSSTPPPSPTPRSGHGPTLKTCANISTQYNTPR